MFDGFIALLEKVWDDLRPYYMVEHVSQAVHLRFGKLLKITEPGIHFKVPFFDKIIPKVVVATTMSTPPQSLTTKDGVSVVVEAIVKYRIDDTRKLYENVHDSIDALSDTTQGAIFEEIRDRDWAECPTKETQLSVTRYVRKKNLTYGIYVLEVTFSTMDKLRTYRLITDSSSSEPLSI